MLFKLGYRNLWRNKRRTLLTMTAIGTATALVIINLGIYDGMLWDMIEGATELYHGHAKVTAPGYLEDPRPTRTLSGDGLGADLAAYEGVAGVAPRLHGFALLSFGVGDDSESQPAEFLGIDPERELGVTNLNLHVTEGRFLTSADEAGVLLGAGLARRLGAVVGGDLPAMGQAADGSIAQAMFKVVGILDTGDPIRDAMLAVVRLDTLQAFMALEGRIHEWALKLDRPLAAQAWAAAASADYPEVEVVPWHKVLPMIAQYLDIWFVSEIVIAFIFYFAVVLVAANTMSMSFFERLREFAVMGAIGLKPSRLWRLIVLEAVMMSGLAALVGGLVGSAVSLYLYTHYIDLSSVMDPVAWAGAVMPPRLRSYPTVLNLTMPVGLILFLAILVSFFPAWKLKRLRPVDALSEV